MRCLLDTGATHSFIHASFLHQIQHSPIIRTKHQFMLADGNTTVNVDGEVRIYIRVNRITTSITALRTRSLSTSCILGQDWIRKYSVDICQSTRQVVVHTTKLATAIRMDRNLHEHQFDIRLANAITIQPHHEVIARVRAPISSSPTVFFRPNRNVQHHNLIAIPYALLSINDYTSYITITNPTNKVRHIPTNTSIGSFTIQPDDIQCFALGPRRPKPHLQRGSGSVSPNNSDASIDSILDQLLNHLTDPQEKTTMRTMLTKYRALFDTSTPSIAKTTAPPMINTGSHLPIHLRVYRTDPVKQQHISRTINEMLEHKLIEKSYASWSSPVLLIRKKDGSYRFVIDYRPLNRVTERDSYPLPRIEDTLNRLSGNNYFTKFDLKTGYHQIPIHPSDKDKATFVTSHGMFRFNVMPQGLTNAPSSFQRIMYDLLVSTRWDFCLVYIDDVLIFSKTFEQHVDHLNEILSVLQEANLQLNPKKCSLVKPEIDYLGHTINGQGICPLQENIDAIVKLPTPSTPKQVHSFVQAANYYRDHIENFSKIAAPLFVYTKKNATWIGWTEHMENAYNELKRRLTTPPVFLNFPDDESPLVLSIDASGEGMGGVLRQRTPTALRVIKYVSKKFNRAQKKYSTTERECLAMIWCIQKLREYVWRRPVEVETDHCPLCSFNRKNFQNSRIERWQVEMSEFHIAKIRYKRGRCNCDADLLSRFPHDQEDLDHEDSPFETRSFHSSRADPVSPAQLNAVTRSIAKRLKEARPCSDSQALESSSTSGLVESNTNPTELDRSFSQVNTPLRAALYSPSAAFDFSLPRIKAEQMKDGDICHRVRSIANEPHLFPNEVLRDEILCKTITRHGDLRLTVPWVPSSLIPEILSAYHDHPLSGHFGADRTYYRLRDKFYWPRMRDTIKQYVRSCTECTQFNAQRRKKPGHLQTEPAPEGVFEILQMDYWKAPLVSTSGNQYVLVITDRLSKYVFARAFPSATAKNAAEMLFEDVILKHGAIRCIQSDQGTHFKNDLLAGIVRLTGCKQIFSIPYHPMSNGQVERFNSTFYDQLKKYCHQALDEWDAYLQSVVWAYNSSVHSTTKFTPYELAFARRPSLPFDPNSSAMILQKPNDYCEKANRFRTLTLRAARIQIQQQQMLSKKRFDRHRNHPIYSSGDLVWARVLSGRSKFDPRFHGPFTIIQRMTDVRYLMEHSTEGYRQEEHINNLIPFYERH